MTPTQIKAAIQALAELTELEDAIRYLRHHNIGSWHILFSNGARSISVTCIGITQQIKWLEEHRDMARVKLVEMGVKL